MGSDTQDNTEPLVARMRRAYVEGYNTALVDAAAAVIDATVLPSETSVARCMVKVIAALRKDGP